MRLKRNFFIQPTLKATKELLGKYLVREYRGKKIVGRIVETEAYIGPKDKASHAYGGRKTNRNRAEFLKGGHIYIYLVYGMHWQFNISTFKEGEPECVLIRAVEPIASLKLKNPRLRQGFGGQAKIKSTNGPGKLCKYFKLDKSFYSEDLVNSKRIWLESGGEKIKPAQIAKGSRVGIDYAGPYWSKIYWRFWLKDNEFVSKFK